VLLLFFGAKIPKNQNRGNFMNKIIRSLSVLMFVPMLFACAEDSKTWMRIGDGKKENDSVCVEFSLPSTIKKDTKVSFKFSAEKNVEFASSYFFSVFDVDPLLSDSYNETSLVSFTKDKLENLKKDDGSYGDYLVDVIFSDLERAFPKQAEGKGNVHLVLHTDDWSRGEISKCSSMKFTYSYSGENVVIE